MVPETAASTRIDVLTNTMRIASNLLSAAGEHWAEARRSRNNLDELTAATVRWLLDLQQSNLQQAVQNASSQQPRMQSVPLNAGPIAEEQQHPSAELDSFDLDFPGFDNYISGGDLAVFVGAPEPFGDDFSLTVEGMFSEYQPLFDFNPQNGYGASF